jgi:succinyl-diaminopimelate desuccinylase
MRRLIDLCQEFLRTDSTNPTGNIQLANLVTQELRFLGFRVKRQRARLDGVPQVNLIARQGPNELRPLLLNTHLDTVSTAADMWTKTDGNPFNPKRINGRLYGLGAADTKLALACQIVAIEGLDLERMQRPLMITATYGEEAGMVGIHKLIRSPDLNPAFVINSEPTELAPSNGNYGFRIYRVTGIERRFGTQDGFHHRILFKGKAAHSARPELGTNAILNAMHWLKHEGRRVQVVEINGGIAANIVAPDCLMDVVSSSSKLKGLRKYSGRVLESKPAEAQSISPGLTESLKKIPESLLNTRRKEELTNAGRIDLKAGRYEILISHRFAPGISPDEELTGWRRVIKPNDHVSTRISIGRDNPGFRQDPRRPFIRQVQSILRGLGKDSSLVLKPGCTEAMYFARLGCDVLTLGPGESYGNVHAPNESIRIKDLKEAVKFYRTLITKICL